MRPSVEICSGFECFSLLGIIFHPRSSLGMQLNVNDDFIHARRADYRGGEHGMLPEDDFHERRKSNRGGNDDRARADHPTLHIGFLFGDHRHQLTAKNR